MTRWDIERGYMRVTMDTNRRFVVGARRLRRVREVMRRALTRTPRVHANFSVSTSRDSPHSTFHERRRKRSHPVRARTHTRYLEEVRSVVRSSPAILITTSFSHWIRWRVKIEGATLLVSFSDSSIKGYSSLERERVTYFLSRYII